MIFMCTLPLSLPLTAILVAFEDSLQWPWRLHLILDFDSVAAGFFNPNGEVPVHGPKNLKNKVLVMTSNPAMCLVYY